MSSNSINSSDFLRGRYFCSAAEAGLSVTTKPWNQHYWKDFGRSQPLDIAVRKRNESSTPHRPYQLTMVAANGRNSPAPYKSTRSESTTGETTRIIWPVDIVGNPSDRKREVAHLFPAGETVHEEWIGVAAAVLGLPKDASASQQLMATRGVSKASNELRNNDGKTQATRAECQDNDNSSAKNTTSNGGKRFAALTTALRSPLRKRFKAGSTNNSEVKSSNCSVSFDDTAASAKSRDSTMDHTGVVHFVSNKIRLASQKFILDSDTPAMLIIPCKTVQEANEWKGGSYKAVVLTGFPNGVTNVPEKYRDAYGVKPTDKVDKVAAKAFKFGDMADDEFLERLRHESTTPLTEQQENCLLEKACSSLEETVLGLTAYVKEMGDREDLSCLQPSVVETFQERADALGPKVLVPCLCDKIKTRREKPLLFVEFGRMDEREKHPPPDPLLLLAKAAASWGMMNGTTIIANGEVLDEEDYDSLDEQAEEAFCKKYRSCSAPQIPNEISVITPMSRPDLL